MNYSTFPAELIRRAARAWGNESLQSFIMRIELPPSPWADAMLRAEDDAHTLTVDALPTAEWAAGVLVLDPELRLRTEVTVQAPVTLTLTF